MSDTLAGASPVDQPVRPRRADVVPGVMHCARCEDLFDRAKLAEDALRDLVALEDMRLRLRSLRERGHGTDYEYYHNGLTKAWGAARAVLLGGRTQK